MDALQDPWLVAAWPGMGGVAMIAASQLAQLLAMPVVADLDPERFHELTHVSVKRGLLARPALPRSTFHAYHDPRRQRDLLVLVGQRQPEGSTRAYCAALLDEATRRGARRVVTFAAMASFVDPRAPARVYAAATTPALLDAACTEGAEPLVEGQISGLNGAFLAAAEERGLHGLCLLGEIPFFASAIANPKASAAVLRVFSRVAGLPLDLAALDTEAARMEQALCDHLEQLERAAGAEHEPDEDAGHEDEPGVEGASGPGEADEPGARAGRARPSRPATPGTPGAPAPAGAAAGLPPEPELPPEVVARIEALFAQAAADRGKALELKAELDRHGAFARFENRFLDLFRQAG